jgi:hypothetical protein
VQVHSFLAHRRMPGGGNRQQYLVHWESYPAAFDTWVAVAQLSKDLAPKAYKTHVINFKSRIMYDTSDGSTEKEDTRPLAKRVRQCSCTSTAPPQEFPVRLADAP